ncbi:hypothetical protein CPB83DRAFT_769774, partial [Crepidotus variabilis]
RRDPPQCAPETRNEIHRQIKAWANSLLGKARIFWLFGSAGAGKSAICQAIAEMFKREGLLLGNFFFSRSAASTGRSNGDRLLPTLIHQLQEAIPETRPYIKKAIQKDPLIFQKTRASQMMELYIKPLKKLYVRNFFRRHTLGKRICLVVIDGLDKCQDSDVLNLPCSIIGTMTFHQWTHNNASRTMRLCPLLTPIVPLFDISNNVDGPCTVLCSI